jgi:hypothetical protein
VERESLLQLWDEWWKEGIWFASWSETLEGLTPDQAAWRPGSELHSIWQIVAHVCFWREYTLGTLAGRPKPSDEEMARSNFPEPEAVTTQAWEAARARLAESHRRLRETIADERHPLDRLRYHLAHDANHQGQILYLRRMQGLPPIGG